MRDQEHERSSNANQQNRALNKVCPKYRFQTAGVRIDDGNDTHNDNEQVDTDASQIAEHHARQVHDNRHASNLIDDKHDCAEHAKPLAAKAKLQIMICGVNIQLAVNR